MDSSTQKPKKQELDTPNLRHKYSGRLSIKARHSPGGGAVLQVGFLPTNKPDKKKSASVL